MGLFEEHTVYGRFEVTSGKCFAVMFDFSICVWDMEIKGLSSSKAPEKSGQRKNRLSQGTLEKATKMKSFSKLGSKITVT